MTPELFSRWERELERWAAPPAVRQSLERLADPKSVVVVTGQQPGFWGGPLYSMLKAATAVAVSRRAAERTGRQGVPVFWVQGDDTDWDEVGWGSLPRRDLRLVRHRWSSAPIASRHWVGSARPAAVPELSAVFGQWGWDERVSAFDFDGGSDLSDHFIGCLLALFGERGLLPLDSRWPELRVSGRDLWRDYVGKHEEVARKIRERAVALREQGLAAPLEDDTVDQGLFVLQGEHRLRVDPGRWEAEVKRTLDGAESHRLAPSVLLRAVLQDHLLGTAAHVAGRVEGAYLRQLAPVYEELSVPPPKRPPRLHATLIPAGLLPADRMSEIIENPEGWIHESAEARIPPEAREALVRLRRETERGLEVFGGAAGGETEVENVIRSAARRIESQVARLEDILSRQGRRSLYRERPRLRNVPEFLRPRRGQQDRGLSAATLLFLFGPTAGEVLLGAADAHLDRLQDGEEHHFALEAIRE
jgi:uncharacterized protein YllA (UPF0747 family)